MAPTLGEFQNAARAELQIHSPRPLPPLPH
jgi:hypothetical protein